MMQPHPMSRQSAAFRRRIRKTLYYGKLPKSKDRPSLPVTKIAVQLFSSATMQQSLEQLDLDKAAFIGRDRNLCPCSFMLAFLYLDRLGSCNPQYLQNVSSDKVFIASLMAAGKYLYDWGENNQVYNSDWADMLNTSLDDINQLELDFLDAIDWNVYISDEMFFNKFSLLERYIAFSESEKRGWFSYTDVDVLWKQQELQAFWKNITENVLKVLAVCVTTYMVGVLTLVASVYTADRITTTAINAYNNHQTTVQQPIEIPIVVSDPACPENQSNVPELDVISSWTEMLLPPAAPLENNDSSVNLIKSLDMFPNQSSSLVTSAFDYKALSSAVHELYSFSKYPIVATWHFQPWKIVE